MIAKVCFVLENGNIESFEFSCIDYLDFTIELYKKIVYFIDLYKIEPLDVVVKFEKK